jgi:hypothetical protein
MEAHAKKKKNSPVPEKQRSTTVPGRSRQRLPFAFLDESERRSGQRIFQVSKIWLRISAGMGRGLGLRPGWKWLGPTTVRELEKKWYCTVDKVAPCPVPFLFRTGLLHDLSVFISLALFSSFICFLLEKGVDR